MTEEKTKSFEERAKLRAENERLHAEIEALKKKAGRLIQTQPVQGAPSRKRRPSQILTTNEPRPGWLF